MTLYEWAAKHAVGWAALQELADEVLNLNPGATPEELLGKSEGAVVNAVRLEASRKGLRVWRNNVGAGYAEDGSFLRWGLANDSAQVNKILKSSDLIGLRPIVVGPHHVGRVIGQFVARECKHPGWKMPKTPSERERAQLNFINLVNALGGDAKFATDDTTL